MTDRDPLRPTLRRQITDVNLLYRTLGDAIESAVGRQMRLGAPERPVTEADRRAIMREVSRGLDAIWGQYNGDPDAAMRAAVVRDTTAARFAPLDAAVRDYRRAMSRELQRRIESEASR